MKANELRIGSLIYFDGHIIGTITQIKDTVARVKYLIGKDDERQAFVEYDRIEGIPLTEEWLERLGFKKINHIHDSDYFLHSLVKIAIYPNGMVTLRGSAGWNRIHFVHQLQNLYFALTGQEITLKDK
jgi:hypothetical protein